MKPLYCGACRHLLRIVTWRMTSVNERKTQRPDAKGADCLEASRWADDLSGNELASGAVPFDQKALSNPEPSYWTRTTSISMRPITCMSGKKSANAAGEVRLLRASVMWPAPTPPLPSVASSGIQQPSSHTSVHMW